MKEDKHIELFGKGTKDNDCCSFNIIESPARDKKMNL